ncbi:uracil-DNA glycosylase [Litorimonas sp. RW-G-Af-16]|uniref:uracil-DNA glycosylase n=1 Tax=Litorimonas sp. RW-G-Af-16 TaxID=3241168 RepID=UPI00390CB13B
MTYAFDAPYGCSKCPRLRNFIEEKKREFPDYFNGPVPSFGDPEPRLLIIGLAPGLHGANQTGRPFTGDWAGDLLYAAIAKYGFSNDRYKKHADDGLVLFDAMITNAVRCVPPQNKPVGLEIRTCRNYLKDQMKTLQSVKVYLCLGKVSHDSTVRGLGLKLSDYPFGHHAKYHLPDGRVLISSYHCSRYNTNTKRLTEKMFFDVFADVRKMIGN